MRWALPRYQIPMKALKENKTIGHYFWWHIHAKIINKIQANLIEQSIKRVIHHDQVGLINGVQGWFNILKSVNVIHINSMNEWIIQILWSSVRWRKNISWNSKPFYDKQNQKPLYELGIEWIYFDKIKTIYDRPKAHLIVNGDKLKAFPLRVGKRKGYLHTWILFNVVLNVLARASGKLKN